MLNLKSYRNLPKIDTHIHLFDKDGKNPFYDGGTCIGFTDVNDNVNYYDLYKDYMSNNHINGILLATGRTPEEIIRIYSDFDCGGFGELKYHKESKKISYNQTHEWLQEILKYNSSLNNDPILIHCDFVENIIPIINEFPEMPIVHCHCGCPDPDLFKEDTIRDEYIKATQLSKKYQNYYYDLSWSVAEFLHKHPEYLKYNNSNKLLIGTDLNQKLDDIDNGSEKAAQAKEIYNNLRNVYGNCSDMNALRIFRM